MNGITFFIVMLPDEKRINKIGHSSNADRLTSIAQCDLYLGMRLHSIILALMHHIPVIGVNYDPKIQLL
ncbi:MAG: polysaccharide pyruvyl transferase family protein [Proteobacteria bacterium]|nr:polysaccharide pyruvyl transferase family protein [Pseudomonadota bacterium]